MQTANVTSLMYNNTEFVSNKIKLLEDVRLEGLKTIENILSNDNIVEGKKLAKQFASKGQIKELRLVNFNF